MAAAPPWLDSPELDHQSPALRGGSDELERLRTMSSKERLEHFVQACELARAILEHRPDVSEVLQRRVPLSAEAEATWLRLCAEGRRARAA